MENLEKLTRDLKNPNPKIRLQAVSAIKEAENNGIDISPVIPALLEVLCNEDKQIRWAALDIVSAYGIIQ